MYAGYIILYFIIYKYISIQFWDKVFLPCLINIKYSIIIYEADLCLIFQYLNSIIFYIGGYILILWKILIFYIKLGDGIVSSGFENNFWNFCCVSHFKIT